MDAYPPSSVTQVTAEVLANEPIARETFRLRLDAPSLAGPIRPGQFVMVRPAIGTDPLLGRPFALYDMILDDDGTPRAIDLVYQVVGRGTRAISRLRPGDPAVAWGPLGNGFGPAPDGPAIFVAGGIGQTPFLALGKAWLGRARYGQRDGTNPLAVPSATLLYGVRSAKYAAGLADFEAAGIGVELATDDGSAGHRGFVTELLAGRLSRGERPAKVVGCGPAPMLAALARLADAHGLDCDLSLENHMACGFGACFSCVTPIRQPDGSTDLRRVCVEGPIFPSRVVAWPS